MAKPGCIGRDGALIGRVVRSFVEALEKGPQDRGVLILADSRAAIQAVKKAGRTGKARTGELVRVLGEVRKRYGRVRLAWVSEGACRHARQRAGRQTGQILHR